MLIQEHLGRLRQVGFEYDGITERPVLKQPALFFRFIVNRDTTYMYSDDRSVYNAGEQAAELLTYVINHNVKAAVIHEITKEYMALCKVYSEEISKDCVRWQLTLYTKFEREFLELIEHPCVEVVDILSEGTGNLTLAEKNLESLNLMVGHIDSLAKALADKLVQWKPSNYEVFWDDIHVPESYHQELRKILDYFSKELLRDGLNTVLSLLVGKFKYLQIDNFFRKTGFSKKPGPPGYRVTLLVPGTPYRYVMRRLS